MKQLFLGISLFLTLLTTVTPLFWGAAEQSGYFLGIVQEAYEAFGFVVATVTVFSWIATIIVCGE